MEPLGDTLKAFKIGGYAEGKQHDVWFKFAYQAESQAKVQIPPSSPLPSVSQASVETSSQPSTCQASSQQSTNLGTLVAF